MCGIMGAINREDMLDIVRVGLDKIKYRGIDGKGIWSDDRACFGHCLHSVVGNRKQPLIKEQFVFGANCEIYNWKELAKKYSIPAENDAELLFEFLILYLNNKNEINKQNINKKEFNATKINQTKIDNELINNALSQLDGVFSFFIYN